MGHKSHRMDLGQLVSQLLLYQLRQNNLPPLMIQYTKISVLRRLKAHEGEGESR